MVKFFMPMSGNLGDTLNVMPVISGIYKNIGHKIILIVRDRMRAFVGFKEFMEMQDPIAELKFESEIVFDKNINILSLADNFPLHYNRPYETVRFEVFLQEHYKQQIEPDDNFILNVPNVNNEAEDKFIVGDRTMSTMGGDQRRWFDFLKASGKFDVDKCYFLDYNKPVAFNAGLIKLTQAPIFTTFTGISNIADLLNKETIILWADDLYNWDNKPIEYSFYKHFYRDRKCRLMYLGDFKLSDFEV